MIRRMDMSSDRYRMDFDTPIERRGTGSLKWDSIKGDVLPMWVADMDLPCPPEVTQALRNRVEHPVYGYPAIPDSYYDACIGFLRTVHDRTVERRWMLPVAGVMPGLRAAVDAFSKPGESVVVPSPVYPPFFHAVKSKGRVPLTPRLVRRNGRYVMDLDELERSIRDDTRVLLLCSPHNPVGRVWTREELEALGEICLRKNIVIVSDEIHADILLPGVEFASISDISPELSGCTVSLISPSKTFNIPGVSTAVAVVPNDDLRRNLKNAVTAAGVHHPSLFGIIASEAAWRHGVSWLMSLREYLAANLEMVYEFGRENFESVEVTVQDGTYIAWIDFEPFLSRTGMPNSELHRFLKVDGKVELSYGPDFGPGGDGFMRLNFGTSAARLKDGLDRITGVLLKRTGPEA
jgi:cysteine-S-conjugate beta-lyase